MVRGGGRNLQSRRLRLELPSRFWGDVRSKWGFSDVKVTFRAFMQAETQVCTSLNKIRPVVLALAFGPHNIDNLHSVTDLLKTTFRAQETSKQKYFHP